MAVIRIHLVEDISMNSFLTAAEDFILQTFLPGPLKACV